MWIEITDPRGVDLGKHAKKGARVELPMQAAIAIVSTGRAKKVNGPLSYEASRYATGGTDAAGAREAREEAPEKPAEKPEPDEDGSLEIEAQIAEIPGVLEQNDGNVMRAHLAKVSPESTAGLKKGEIAARLETIYGQYGG